MLLDKICEEDINIGVKAEDWEDAIKKSSLYLLEKGKIKQSYIDAMIDAVKRVGPYIVLGNHVALAHARPECGVNELSLHFTTLTPAIPFGSEKFDPIKLIITLAATNANSHLELMASLAEVLMEEENVNVLVASKTPKEFIEKLNKMRNEE